MKATVKIDGMMCMHCVSHVQEALKAVNGVISAEADLKNKCAYVEFENPATVEALEKAVLNAGYSIIK